MNRPLGDRVIFHEFHNSGEVQEHLRTSSLQHFGDGLCFMLPLCEVVDDLKDGSGCLCLQMTDSLTGW